MKKTILVAIFLGGIFAANAQTTPSTKVGTTTLNVNLYPIQEITVKSLQKTVNLDYKSAADYRDGVNLDQKDHLSVYSTGAFAVSVSGANLANTITKTSTINGADIAITASNGTSILAGAKYTPATLSTTAKTLISSTKGGVNKQFNVNYAAKGGTDAFINKYYKSQGAVNVYTTTITYTIAPI